MIGPFEEEARAYLGERTSGIPESQYLFSLAELVRTSEKLTKAMQINADREKAAHAKTEE